MAEPLTPLENQLVALSTNLETTRKRLRFSMASATIMAVVVAAAGFWTKSWVVLTVGMIAYIGGVAWERAKYARTVMAYKQVIAKLAAEVSELRRRPPDL